MGKHESVMAAHALEVLRLMLDQDRRPLTPCEKLACRVLLPIVGKRELVLFCDTFENGNPLYRSSHLSLSFDAICRNVNKRYGCQSVR